MIVIDDETGQQFDLRFTDELSDELAAIKEDACDHPHSEPRRRIIKGGGITYWIQCQTCGRTLGSAISKASVPNISQLPDLDVDLAKRWTDDRAARRNTVIQKHVRLQKAEKAQWWRDYNDYLSSPEWRQKRRLVLDRSGGICEGCRMRPADQVHHLTYRHVYREFLWELAAVCKSCHELAHEDDEAPEDPYAEDKARLAADNNEPYGDERDAPTTSG